MQETTNLPINQQFDKQPTISIEKPLIATTKIDHVVFIAVTIFYWTTLYIYVPILTPYLEYRGLSLQLIGFVLGSYGLTQILIRFPLGLASDKLRKRKPFIMLGLITGALSCLLFTIPGSWMWPLAGRVLSGVCASTWVAFTVLYANYFAQSGAIRAMGSISFMTVSGQLIGMALSGWMAQTYGWNSAFQLGIVFGIAGLLIAFAVREPREGIERAPMSFADLREVVRTPILLRVSTLSILAHCILFITMFGFTPLKATAELGASKVDLTAVVFAFMIPHAFASLYSARWFAPRFGTSNIILAGFVLSGICTAAIAFSPSLLVLMLTQAVNGFAQGLYFPLLLGKSIQDFPPDKRATAMGFYQAVYSSGMFVGPFLAGWLNGGWGIDSGFYLGALFAAAAVVLVLRWKRAL
jgi:MFS family permease